MADFAFIEYQTGKFFQVAALRTIELAVKGAAPTLENDGLRKFYPDFLTISFRLEGDENSRSVGAEFQSAFIEAFPSIAARCQQLVEEIAKKPVSRPRV